mmetsp:Transcript_29054/g.43898  ORF Transcript_29054/g.43898 Transcript_29054/m.43898 type:complete len:432 (-) Transcript_29054:12-1307(-)
MAMLIRMLLRKKRFLCYPLGILSVALLLSAFIGTVIFHTIAVMRTLPNSHSSGMYAKHVQLARSNNNKRIDNNKRRTWNAKLVGNAKRYTIEKILRYNTTATRRRTILQTGIDNTRHHTNQESSNNNLTTIAYAISLRQCREDYRIDAAVVLQHSIYGIHQKSKTYNYQMLVLVPAISACSQLLERVGFQTIVVEPISKTITEDILPWHSYRLTNYPVVVHIDVNVAFVKPLDHLYDSMLLKGRSATPVAIENNKWRDNEATPKDPSNIGAYYTRDSNLVVVKPNATVWDELLAMKANLSRHNNRTTAMGLLTHYYTHVRPARVMELKLCQYHWREDDNNYQCRSNRCICRLSNMTSIQFSPSCNPWNCTGIQQATSPQCSEVIQFWYSLRRDLEQSAFQSRSDEYCHGSKQQQYNPISDAVLSQIPKLYQ